jgi:hypothetical protein
LRLKRTASSQGIGQDQFFLEVGTFLAVTACNHPRFDLQSSPIPAQIK